MADIAFLLLIFFLVTTTIVQDKGILVKLPPWTGDDLPQDIASRNVFKVFVNRENKILARGDTISIELLRNRIKDFISNPEKKSSLSSSPQKAIISLQNDRATEYSTYLMVYNEIKAAYNELRNDLANQYFGITFKNCNKEQHRTIRKAIPLIISEAEPTDYKQLNK